MKSLKSYLKKAQKEKWAIGQFNFSSLEQLRGIIFASKETKRPVILGTSEGELGYLGLKETIALVEILKAKEKVDVFLNLDHAKDLKLIKKAIDYGYSAVHFDGSHLSLEKNINYAKKVVEYAHKKGVLVEGEIGYIRGSSKPHKEKAEIKKADLTLPEKALYFVEKTGVDSLAIAIGNVHGIYQVMPNLDLERLERINNLLKKKVFLVLHGGSGIKPSQIKEAIKRGIVKININTEIRLTWKKTLSLLLREEKTIKPYEILPKLEKEIQKKVQEKIKLFCKR